MYSREKKIITALDNALELLKSSNKDKLEEVFIKIKEFLDSKPTHSEYTKEIYVKLNKLKEELIKDLDNTQKTTREEILKVQNHLKYITINERLRNR